jgi:hypothetical protein
MAAIRYSTIEAGEVSGISIAAIFLITNALKTLNTFV